MATDVKAEVGAYSNSSHKNKGKGVAAAPKQMSRRNFLAATLATVAGSASAPSAFGFLRRFGHRSNREDEVKVTFVETKKDPELVALEKKQEHVLDVVFGADKEEARPKVEEIKALVSAKAGFEAANLMVPKRYESHIREQARENGVDGDIMIGLVGIENGGGEDLYGDDGKALGVMQFWEGTARDYGLVVNSKIDERLDPIKSIAAGAEYVKVHKQILGDNEGLAIWAFNVGMGNAFKALQTYFVDTKSYNIGNYSYAIEKGDPKLRMKIEQDAAKMIKDTGVTVQKILTNKAVLGALGPNLYSGFEDYPYKVAAIAQLFQEQPKAYVAAAR